MNMKAACQYAIVTFLPYAETGEFANIGVILTCPDRNYLGAKVAASRRSKRVTDFFEGLDPKIYREAIKYLNVELKRVKDTVGADFIRAHAAFHEVVRPREALIRFSAPKAILADDPAATLEKLFNHYVQRDFATKEYHEALLTRGVANLLQRASLRNYFKQEAVGDEIFNVQMPFVGTTKDDKQIVIKPLHLAQPEPSKILDHGLHWVARVEQLRKRRRLPQHFLFAVNSAFGPGQQDAAGEVIDQLLALGVQLTNAKDEAAILDFAEQAKPQLKQFPLT